VAGLKMEVVVRLLWVNKKMVWKVMNGIDLGETIAL
jgi:hypothetical protein